MSAEVSLQKETDYTFIKTSLQAALGDFQPPEEAILPSWFKEDDGRQFFAVGERLYGEIEAACAAQPGVFRPGQGIMFGCLVLARGIERCYDAYQEYCETQNQVQDPEKLLTALRNPATTRVFSRIAGMCNDRAHIYELWLGLDDRRTSVFNEFDYSPEAGCFTPNNETWDTAQWEAERWSISHGLPNQLTDPAPNQCPASTLLPQLWLRAVDIATEVTENWQQFRPTTPLV